MKDDAESTRAAIERGLEADVLITSGGVSVGVHDLVRTTEAELGVEEVFWRVAVRPGKPVAFGVRGRTLVFGLPGNPVSSLVGFELFVRPALLALQGLDEPRPAFKPGRLGRSVRTASSAIRCSAPAPGSRTATVVLDPLTGQESHMIARAAMADALVLVPRGDRRAGGRRRRLVSQPVGAGSTPSARADTDRDRAHELAERPARPPLARVGVGGVAAGRRRGELARGCGSREGDREPGELHVADPDQLEQVPRRVEPEAVAPRERSDEQRRPDQPGDEQQHADRRPGDPDLRQPEPDVDRRQDEEERERVHGRHEQRDDEQGQQRDGVAGHLLLGGDRAPHGQTLTGEQPAEPDDDAERDQRDRRPVAGDRGFRVHGACRAGRPGPE